MTTRSPLPEHVGKYTLVYREGEIDYYTGKDMFLDTRKEALRYCEEREANYMLLCKIEEDYPLYKVEPPPITSEEIKQLFLERKLEITDVIDCIIELNGYIGVGLISLGDWLREYVHGKIKR